MILGIIKLILGALIQGLPVFFELKEKQNEAVEVDTDPDSDDSFWNLERLS